jgi:hypothetical protein
MMQGFSLSQTTGSPLPQTPSKQNSFCWQAFPVEQETPLSGTKTQPPSVHAATKHGSVEAGQAMSHVPQYAVSLSRSTHAPLQQVDPPSTSQGICDAGPQAPSVPHA